MCKSEFLAQYLTLTFTQNIKLESLNTQLYILIIQVPQSSNYTTSWRTDYNRPTTTKFKYQLGTQFNHTITNTNLNLKNSINLQLQAYNQFILMQAHINQIIHTYQIHVHV